MSKVQLGDFSGGGLVGDDNDKSFVHCKLRLDTGNEKKVQVKYCSKTTTYPMQHLNSWHKEDHKAAKGRRRK